MEIINTNFKDLKIYNKISYKDKRGYTRELFKNNSIKKKFPFDLLSLSKKNVIRGLHLQIKRPQGKFVSVLKGKVFDVALDLRKSSKSFMKYYSIELNQEDNKSLLIPPGFAHGFQALEDKSQLIYAHSMEYKKDFESGCNLKDPKVNIKWPLKLRNLSKKDIQLPFVKDIEF